MGWKHTLTSAVGLAAAAASAFARVHALVPDDEPAGAARTPGLTERAVQRILLVPFTWLVDELP